MKMRIPSQLFCKHSPRGSQVAVPTSRLLVPGTRGKSWLASKPLHSSSINGIGAECIRINNAEKFGQERFKSGRNNIGAILGLSTCLAAMASDETAESAPREAGAKRKTVPELNEEFGEVEICRIMLPDDANIAGNVHGGCILKLIDEAGWIVATRHCNKGSTTCKDDKHSDCLVGALARIEHMDFLAPMFIGEVAKLQAKVVYTSEKSIQVIVTVWAENSIKGTRRLTNRATLWYVGVQNKDIGKGMKAVKVPNFHPESEHEKKMFKAGEQLYIKSKRRRDFEARRKMTTAAMLEPTSSENGNNIESGQLTRRVSDSECSLVSLLLPSDCHSNGLVQGGTIMKLMDSAAGIVSARHCRTNVVTARIDTLDFNEPMFNGHLAHVNARLNFVSSKSMEIEVTVEDEDFHGNKRQTARARFTFVSLGKDLKPLTVPGLELVSEAEKRRFEEGKMRYEERKLERSVSFKSK